MRIFYLKNLTDTAVQEADVQAAPDPLHKPGFKDKDAYREWCNNPKTDHVFLNLSEGTNASLRVSKSNPAVRIYGVVGEYDATQPADVVDRFRQAQFPPTWVTRTQSGHARVYWAFEKPVAIANAALAAAFYKIFFKEVQAKKLAPGFEEKESSDPHHYYELGSDWTQTATAPIATGLVTGWVVRACEQVNWKREGGPVVPLDKVREECARRWPGGWPGGWEAFELGARGVRFWDPSADAAAAIVRETGLTCYTGDEPFKSWVDLLGTGFIRRTVDSTIGDAITQTYLEAGSGKYYVCDTSIKWVKVCETAIKRRLAAKGISSSCPKGQMQSDMDRALLAIDRQNTIHGAYAFFHQPAELIEVNQGVFLNTSNLKLMQPHDDDNPFGQGFPFWEEFLQKLFGPEQYLYYMHWLAHYYRSCLRGCPERGLTLFIAGPASCGKTFLNNTLHKWLFGGIEDASAFLLGSDQFNDGLFAMPIWCVDDAVAADHIRDQNKFSQMVKLVAANDSITIRAMYKSGTRLPWMGRVVITMNDDPESLRLLPNIDTSMIDKIMLLRGHPTFHQFPTDEALMREVPYLAAYLRDMTDDPAIWVGGRFGVAPYHHPDLLDMAKNNLQSTSAKEVISRWAKHYFSDGDGAGQDCWRGNPTELLSEILSYDRSAVVAQGLFRGGPPHVGRALAQLARDKTSGVTFCRTAQSRDYQITPEVMNRPQPEQVLSSVSKSVIA